VAGGPGGGGRGVGCTCHALPSHCSARVLVIVPVEVAPTAMHASGAAHETPKKLSDTPEGSIGLR
jgi:hypothetical protein